MHKVTFTVPNPADQSCNYAGKTTAQSFLIVICYVLNLLHSVLKFAMTWITENHNQIVGTVVMEINNKMSDC